MYSHLKQWGMALVVGFGLLVPGAVWSQQEEASKGDRWIGVAVGQVPEIVRAHLDVDPAVGVIVLDVVPESPAAKGGIQRHDVITQVNAHEVRSLQDLITTIRAAEQDEVQLDWHRGGKSHTATITAAPRPAELDDPRSSTEHNLNQDGATDLSWADLVEQLRAGRGDLRGMVFRVPDTDHAAPFPKGLSVQIERQNDEPAKITVQRDGQTWQITEDEIDKLPEDLQGHVRRMLGGNGALALPGSGMMFKDLDLQVLPPGSAVPKLHGEMNERLEEMNRRMEKMLEELRGLRREHEQNELHPPAEKQLESESADKA